MKRSISSVLLEADAFFMKQSPLFTAAQRIARHLREMEIPFAIAGALAVNAHGHRRTTVDIDILLRPDGLQQFKARWLGIGWIEKFPGSRGIRDTQNNVNIDILLTGDYPGDGLPKPVAFPDPEQASELDDEGIPTLTLPHLFNLKLASGMTAPDRPRDFDDCIQLIRVNELPISFMDQLNPYVHQTYERLWHAAQHRDEY